MMTFSTSVRTLLREALLLAIPVVLLGTGLVVAKDDDKTGYEDDDIFYDNRYDYSFELPKDWKIGKTYDDPDEEPSNCRVITYKKKFRVPVKLQGNRQLVQRPTAIVLIGPTELPPAQFYQKVATAHELSNFEDAIVSKSILLQRAVEVPAQVDESLNVEVAGKPAVRWKVRLEYAHQLETQFGPKSVRDWKVGYIYLVPLDDLMMYIEMVSENQSFDSLAEEFGTIINSLTFAGDVDADSTGADAAMEKSSGDK